MYIVYHSVAYSFLLFFFFSSRRRHTRFDCDWSSDVCSSDLGDDRRPLGIALALILGFMAAEVVVGILADSLALISDAGHMLTDAAAIGLSLVAARLARRPAEAPMTYGLGRAEILSAQVNGITLLVLAALITWEAVQRLASPPRSTPVPCSWSPSRAWA